MDEALTSSQRDGPDGAQSSAQDSTAGRLAFLDGWRGLAVSAVLIGHFYGVGISLFDSAKLGVELFFVLSGRLMAEILFLKPVRLRTFFLRRFSRVWPAYFLFVIVAGLAFRGPVHPAPTVADFVTAFTFTINYKSALGVRAPVFDHLWSLSVEEWIYVLLALLLLIRRRLPSVPPLALIGGATAALLANGILASVLGEQGIIYWRTDTRGASILAGAALFLALRRRTIHPAVPVACGILGSAVYFGPVPDVVRYTVGTLLLAGSVATIDRSPGWCRETILSSPILRTIGIWSFSLYLWQQPFYKLVDRNVGIHLTRWIAIPAAIAAALLSFYLVEQPARRFLNRRFARQGESPVTG